MSLAESEKAVDALSPEDLAKLAAYIARHDKLAWDEEIERDFSARRQTRGLTQKNRRSSRSRQFHAVAVTSRARFRPFGSAITRCLSTFKNSLKKNSLSASHFSPSLL